jgi:hypothetical protein
VGQGGAGGGVKRARGVSLSLSSLSLLSLSFVGRVGGVGVSYDVYSVAALLFLGDDDLSECIPYHRVR